MTDPTTEIVRTLDLRGVACPLNYVKTKVALERLSPGEAIEVWLEHGEPEENVPRSCDEDGYRVVSVADAVQEGTEGFVRLIVTTGA